MINEIEQISHAMIILNSQVYGAILSEKDLNLLEKDLIKINFNRPKGRCFLNDFLFY